MPTSIEEGRLCINGMSYSNRGSKWANSALVVSVGSLARTPSRTRAPTLTLTVARTRTLTLTLTLTTLTLTLTLTRWGASMATTAHGATGAATR